MERFDLEVMLKEIKEDKAQVEGVERKLVSQDVIRRLVAEEKDKRRQARDNKP